MIYKSAHRLFVTFEGESCGREQFPVAVVSEDGGACLPLVVIFFYLLLNSMCLSRVSSLTVRSFRVSTK